MSSKGASVSAKGEQRRIVSQYLPSGVKNDRFFNRKGFASVMDSKTVNDRLESFKNGIGDGGYRLAYVDKAGGIVTNSVVNLPNGVFTPNDRGHFVFKDKEGLEERARLKEMEEQYIDQIVNYCATDEMMKEVLDFDDNQFEEICDESWAGVADPKLPKKLMVDCHPSYMSLLPPKSLEASTAMAKLRYVCKLYKPIIEEHTGTHHAIKEEMS